MYNETKKASNNRYLSQFKPVSLRIKPEELERIKEAAERAGESMAGYILHSCRDRMTGEHDVMQSGPGVQLPAGVLDLAEHAAKQDGKSLTDWICKAIQEQDRADTAARQRSIMLKDYMDKAKGGKE